MPKTDNANYLWIQIFYRALNDKGRAGFVMANSAGDARGSELEIRKKLHPDRRRGRDDRQSARTSSTRSRCPARSGSSTRASRTARKDKVLFIDARHIFRQIDRAHREFTPEQIEFIANIVRLYRGEAAGDRRAAARSC